MNRHKAKCDVLKKIRKNIADRLGIDLHQRECTFEGECTGTCPKCKQEEDILNREIARRAGALAVGATASLMLTACVPVGITQPTGDIDYPTYDGGITYEETDEIPPNGGLIAVDDELMGDPALPEEFVTAGEPAFELTDDPDLPDVLVEGGVPDGPEEDEESALEQEEAEDEGTAGVSPDDGAD